MGEKLLTLNNGLACSGYKLKINDPAGYDDSWVYSSFPTGIYLEHWNGSSWDVTHINQWDNNWTLFYQKLPFIDEIKLVDNVQNGSGKWRCRNLFKDYTNSYYTSSTNYSLWFYERTMKGDGVWEWKSSEAYSPMQGKMRFYAENGQNRIYLCNASTG